MRYGFGIDLGGTTVKLACFEESGLCIDKWEIPTDKKNGGAHILPDIVASVQNYIKAHALCKKELFGIGIGVPGPVENDARVLSCVNLGWGKTEVAKELSSLIGLPVAVGNDANIAALGECAYGAGNDNMLFITLGTGVGGGVVVDGKILPGVHGAGGEIGHICLNPAETVPCNCGRFGCAEQYLSATSVVRLAKNVFDTPDLTCEEVFHSAENGDTRALSVLNTYFDSMGRFLSILTCIVDPEVIIFGGGVSRSGEFLLRGVQTAFYKYAFGPTKNVRFAIASLGNDAGIYGAFALAKQSFLK